VWTVVVLPFTIGTSGSVDMVLLGVILPDFVDFLSLLWFLVCVPCVLELSVPLVDDACFGASENFLSLGLLYALKLCIPLVRDDARPAALDDFLSLSSGDRPLYLPDEFLPLFGSRSPGNLLLFVLLDPLGVLAIHFVFKVTPWLDFSLVLFAEFTVADLFILPVEAVGCWFWASAFIPAPNRKSCFLAFKSGFPPSLVILSFAPSVGRFITTKYDLKKTWFIRYILY
jgi:hypothetical protein